MYALIFTYILFFIYQHKYLTNDRLGMQTIIPGVC